MRKIAFLAQKGGAGKSTLATQLAVLASQRDELACLIDIDPQGSAYLWKTFRKKKTPIVLKALPDNLAQVIAEAERLDVTVLLVDTPPHTDKVAIEAIRAADLIVCPTKPELFTLGALADTVRLLDLAQCKRKALAVINDLPTAKAARAQAFETATVSLKRFGLTIAEQTIGHSQSIVDAITDGLGITERSPKSASAKEITALWEEINSKWPASDVREAAQ